MPSNASDSSKLPRITFSLGTFDEKVVEKMAERREVSKSEIVRNLVHNWIEDNAKLLKESYGLVLEEITRELRLESKIDIIKGLLKQFKRATTMTLDNLASILDLNPKDLIIFINENGDELENQGLNLEIDGEDIKKISN